MKWFTSIPQSLLAVILLAIPSSAQTYSNCNPLTGGTCPADSALGSSVTIDFTKGGSDSFTAQGSPSYTSNGAGFTVAKSGDSPQLTSKWYIMFGHVEVVSKAAPGAGIVSSFVLQSDDLDEIDWEWLGADPDQVQTNYFGKGQTTTYNRGAFSANSGSQSAYHTYTIDWTSTQIVWQIDGKTVRVLTPATAEANQYPQTPMQIKVGSWSGGDSANPAGTIAWAKGPTDYTKGPFTMYVKSIAVTDYSTGTQYKYTGTTGNWQNIQAVGGTISGNSNGKSPSSVSASAPAITSLSSGGPIPFQGTTLYPQATGTKSQYTVTYTNYPGLPSGWTVTQSGKVVPPSSAASDTHGNHASILAATCFIFGLTITGRLFS
ncbi:cell wall glucanase [Microthyrium microscopicum]|uniref:Crh-like protein n=1 Tax=Microthyrium microscopicum TaxID=703497 RepID=A0A6A6U016_9PEZI|nr:cell wall glucanase [Microthyrium microscopicum]